MPSYGCYGDFVFGAGTVLPLDPITVAGSLKLRELLRTATFAWRDRLCRCLEGEVGFKTPINPAVRKVHRWSDGLKHLFHIVLGNTIYRWCAIPMGWSWSCWIAQAIVWMLILLRVGNEKPMFVDADFNTTTELPRFVRLKDGGFVSVTYDNIGIWCNNQDALLELQDRIVRNMNMFHAIIKPDSLQCFSAKQMLRQENLPVHLGIEFSLKGRKRVLHWRMDPTRIAQWQKEQLVGALDNISARNVARLCGRIIRFFYIALEPLYECEGVIQVLRRLSRCIAILGWDNTFPIEAQEKNSNTIIVGTRIYQCMVQSQLAARSVTPHLCRCFRHCRFWARYRHHIRRSATPGRSSLEHCTNTYAHIHQRSMGEHVGCHRVSST